MPSTRYTIAEQVQLQIGGGYVDVSAPVQREDIYKRIEQKVNEKFKFNHFAQTLSAGETIPENVSLATYENVTVTSIDGGKSYSLLPVTPVSLPRNMGVYLVYNSRTPENIYIPLQRGQLALLRADELLNDLMGQIGYELKNDRIIFTKDLTMFGVSSVTMELVVFDMSQYSDTSYLPIPADYESKLVEELVAEFSRVIPETGIANNFTSIAEKTTKQ